MRSTWNRGLRWPCGRWNSGEVGEALVPSESWEMLLGDARDVGGREGPEGRRIRCARVSEDLNEPATSLLRERRGQSTRCQSVLAVEEGGRGVARSSRCRGSLSSNVERIAREYLLGTGVNQNSVESDLPSGTHTHTHTQDGHRGGRTKQKNETPITKITLESCDLGRRNRRRGKTVSRPAEVRNNAMRTRGNKTTSWRQHGFRAWRLRADALLRSPLCEA